MKIKTAKISNWLITTMLFLLPFSASAVNITCVYNVDTGVLEATQPWRNTLGAIADRICLSAGRPLQQNQPIAAQSQAATGAALSSKPNEDTEELIGKYNVLASDKTAVQVINRWAKQAGYMVKLNGHFVVDTFPKHPVSYADIAIAKAGETLPQKTLRDAVTALRAKFVGPAYEKLTFNTVVDPNATTIYIEINPKTK